MAGKPWSAPGRLPRCDKCDKEFEKLLRCGRCGNAFYCSRDCQNTAWPRHKNTCRKPDPDSDEEEERAKVAATKQAAKAEEEAKRAAERKAAEPSEEEVEEREKAAELRRDLLRETQVINAKMIQAMQDGKGDPVKFLQQVVDLRDEYQRWLVDALQSQKRLQKAKKADDQEEEDLEKAAEKLGQSLMKEVIMAVLQRGISKSACVDQIDIANNHFAAGILSPRLPKEFALEDGDLDGFEPAVSKLMDKSLVCVDGLLDDEIATVIWDECKAKFWDNRSKGSMRCDSGGVLSDSFETWLPNPPRQGTSPELAHALRVLFGLPHEIQRHGYPHKLQVPTMARLGCLTPGTGREGVHLDNHLTEKGGRELTFMLFLSPGWADEDGGALRTYMLADDDRPGPRPKQQAEADAEEEAADDGPRIKDFEPEGGRCMIFRSRELWHEVLTANRLLFSLTLFVQIAE